MYSQHTKHMETMHVCSIFMHVLFNIQCVMQQLTEYFIFQTVLLLLGMLTHKQMSVKE